MGGLWRPSTVASTAWGTACLEGVQFLGEAALAVGAAILRDLRHGRSRRGREATIKKLDWGIDKWGLDNRKLTTGNDSREWQRGNDETNPSNQVPREARQRHPATYRQQILAAVGDALPPPQLDALLTCQGRDNRVRTRATHHSARSPTGSAISKTHSRASLKKKKSNKRPAGTRTGGGLLFDLDLLERELDVETKVLKVGEKRGTVGGSGRVAQPIPKLLWENQSIERYLNGVGVGGVESSHKHHFRAAGKNNDVPHTHMSSKAIQHKNRQSSKLPPRTPPPLHTLRPLTVALKRRSVLL